jgi:hypothetical protein
MTKIKITVEENQTLIDVAMQHCGNVDRLLDILENNNIVTVNDATGVDVNIAYTLVPGQILELNAKWIETKITKDLKQNIATAEI